MSQNEWEKIKKHTGIYRCPDEITDLTIRVQVREIVNEVPLSKLETAELLESGTFRWQEKVYGKFEREFYKDERNCVTDLDRKYHRDVANMLENDNVLYSYVHDDEFCLQEEKICNSTKVTALSKQMNDLRFLKHKDEMPSDYDFLEHLRASASNPYCENNFELMYIMADFGEYVENTWLKSEYIICSLKYCKKRKLLLVYPDFTKYEPYVLQINGDLTKRCQYFIENLSESLNPEVFERENKILDKISAHQLKLKARTVGSDFATPPRQKLSVYLFGEIVSARNFEYDDIYVQYFVDLPEHWSCLDHSTLKGTTYTSHTNGDDNLAHFGFPFEIALEYDLRQLETNGVLLQLPYIYFEVVSKDTWNRFRIEGLTYKALPISAPGLYRYEMQCLRIVPPNLSGNMRRFFIGDYLSYDDITWFAIPKDYEGTVMNKQGVKTIGTGQIDVKINVVHQSQAFLGDGKVPQTKEDRIFERLSCSALVKSVDQVLEAFKKARKNMMEARRRV